MHSQRRFEAWIGGGALGAILVLCRWLDPAALGLVIFVASISFALYQAMRLGIDDGLRATISCAAGDNEVRDAAGAAFVLLSITGYVALLAAVILATPIAQAVAIPNVAFWIAIAGLGAISQFYVALWANLPKGRGLALLGDANAALSWRRSFAIGASLVRRGLPEYGAQAPVWLAMVATGALVVRSDGPGALSGFSIALCFGALLMLASSVFAHSDRDAAVSGVQRLPRDAARTIPMLLGLAGLAPMANPLLFGTTYAPASDAVFFVLAAAGIISFSRAAIGALPERRRSSQAILHGLVFSAALLAASIKLIPGHGIIGAVAAMVAAAAVAAGIPGVLLIVQSWRERRPFRTLCVYAAFGCAVVMAVAGHWTAETELHAPLYAVLFGVSTFGAFAVLRRVPEQAQSPHFTAQGAITPAASIRSK